MRFASRAVSLPTPRGPVTDNLLDVLTRPPGSRVRVVTPADDPLEGGDTHLALHLAYELRYGGLPGVDDDWENDPGLAAAIRPLEQRFLNALRSVTREAVRADHRRPVKDRLLGLLAQPGGPSLSSYMDEQGTLDEMREFAIHRSAYQLKEADPHTLGIPRLRGRAKAAMVLIQSEEYGSGSASDAHAELFAATMRILGLDDRQNAYLDSLPGTTLATGNLITLLGSRRSLRGALVGHLAAFEMCSVTPMTRYASAMRRLSNSPDAAKFYDVHVAADAVHEQVALHDLVGGLIDDEPALADDVIFGAAALSEVERRFAGALLRSWQAGASSLRGRAGRAA